MKRMLLSYKLLPNLVIKLQFLIKAIFSAHLVNKGTDICHRHMHEFVFILYPWTVAISTICVV